MVDAPVVDGSEVLPESPFVTEFDAIPGFWNYLVGLDHADLMAELIQNDLDQGATRTVISFEKSCLVCEGNGTPVEPEGWERLRKIMGAGDEVPAKRGRIGVKNHGLKTAFTVGDEIWLMSDSKAIVQTLYANGPTLPPHPGASMQPFDHPEAPAHGCRVVVHYRDVDLEPPQGEAIKLAAIGSEEIDSLFRSACSSLPEQFAGIVSPEVTPRYEIVVRHWSFGEARFLFTCTRPRKIRRRMELFRRRCTVTGKVSPLPKVHQEQAVRRLIPLSGQLMKRTAAFFRRGRRSYVEVSWPIDRRGKPTLGIGRFRYPIGYPPKSQEALTGHGAHFNAPFLSDTERRAPARHEATNQELREACESLLVDALAHHEIPNWKADGLRPLVPRPNPDEGDEAARRLLAGLVKRGALPVLNWREASVLAHKGKRQTAGGVKRLLTRWRSKETRRYSFVIPILTFEGDAIRPALSLLCPRSEMQLDPRTHADIIRLLTNKDTPGFYSDFITFDEHDVISRIKDNGNQFFGAIENPEREFSEPLMARAYLDLINLVIDNGECATGEQDALIAALLMPDTLGQTKPLREMYSTALLPADLPGLRLPPVLDTDLATHPIFRRRNWRRRNFTMTRFLDSGTLETADESTRRRFWKWLSRNEENIKPRERTKLADIPIWPDENGQLCKIADLCNPRSRRVGSVLADCVRRPHEQVRRSKLVSAGGKARTSIRLVPNDAEVASWLRTRMARFQIGSTPDAVTIQQLRRFEAELAVLLKDAAIARILRATVVEIPALALDQSVQPRSRLVMPNRKNIRLALPDRYVLKNPKSTTTLEKLCPALNEPTATMLVDSFSEDSSNDAALHARLGRFLAITEVDDDERRKLAEMAIIPFNDRLRPPSNLAFTSTKGDYWGNWKRRISGKGLSPDEQRHYRDVGVTSALPNEQTSQAFFQWLASQEEHVLQEHISCALRHILHKQGPVLWAGTFTDIPFIPARGQQGLQLVSLRTAQQRPVYLSDAGKIGDAIVRKDPSVLLVLDHIKEVKRAISELLRLLGVRSLREALKQPKSVNGNGDVVRASKDFRVRLNYLQSSRFRSTFLKRLNELGVESAIVRHGWQDQLSNVRGIKFADYVELRYGFRRRTYEVEAVTGFDPGSGTFWVKRAQNATHSNFYKSLAMQLIFKPTARLIDMHALELAVGLEIEDPSFGRPGSRQSDVSHDDVVEEESGVFDENNDDDLDPGEAALGHSPFEPNPARNRPNPSPIPMRQAGSSRNRNSQIYSPAEEARDARPTPQIEKQHIDALKSEHYASHCQMCLCNLTPHELAPIGSYVEWEEVRRRVVEAHHTDTVSGGGARHAGNLILLCKTHHDNYGRQLSRAAVAAALRGNAKKKSISFDEQFELDGRQIEIEISGSGETVNLFFTNHHIDYWLLHKQ